MEENQKHLLADMIEEYIESRKYTFREIESYCWYKRVSRIPVAYFREREIYFEDLTTKVVMAFFSEARYKDDGTFYSQKYLHAWRGILKAIIDYMEDEKNVLIKNPFGRQFKMPWVPKYNPRERNIPDDALVKVLEVLRGNYRYQVVSVLLLHTGMRIGELCGLRRSDVDFQAKVIRVRQSVSPLVREVNGQMQYSSYYCSEPKTDSSKRDLPMDTVTEETLRGWMSYVRNDKKLWQKVLENNNEEMVFVNYRGRIMNPSSLRAGFKAYLDERGLEEYNIVFHRYRHTYATHMQDAGVDINIIKELLGHSSVLTTANIYVKTNMLPKVAAQEIYEKHMDETFGDSID